MTAPLRVILGPTAAGKSGVAMQVAMARNLAIVSADSRQVYRGFDIGTAKPSRSDQTRVPHYGIDVQDPTARYSAHAWAHDARGWIAAAALQGREALVVGGTGFYVRALVEPLDELPSLDPAARAALAVWLETLDHDALRRWCTRLDPERASFGRTQQLRAVETALLAGRRLSDAFRGDPTDAAVSPVRYLVVDPGVVLADRIAARVASMWAAGWLEEAEALRRAVPPDAPAWNASGYGQVLRCATGACSAAEAMERIIIETRQYAKRQRTWCRHQLHGGPVTWLNPDHEGARERALAWWDGNDGDDTP